ncbi:MAG TPA: hypothetical protein PLZ95_22320 [Bryobacteraceae bacterium]|nr:hypothetical protein [Bryobacteraceae bacterium]
MRNSTALSTTVRIIAALAAAHCLCAQTPNVAREVQGLPARVAPADYQAHTQVGKVTMAAEFTGHGVPNAQEALYSDGYVVVEVGLFGPADARLTIAATDFSLRINGKKDPLPSQQWGLAAKEIRDPEWVSPEAETGSQSKGGISSSGGGKEPGAPPPSPPKPPIELLRSWQQRVKKAAISEGDRALPQAGLIFFQHRGKVENIRSLELIYAGPAGNATLALK